MAKNDHLRIPPERDGYQPTYYKRIWLELRDGGSDQWLYVVRQSMTYIFLEIIDLVAYCGSDATHQWVASVDIVDLLTTSPETAAEALQSAGWEGTPTDMRLESGRLALAETLRDYGAKAPMWSGQAGPLDDYFDSYGNATKEYSHEGNYFRQLRADARRAAEELFDEETRDEKLDNTIVNAIGQSAREFADGTNGLWDALRRIKDDPNASAEQQLVLKMYSMCEGTVGAGPVPDDLRAKPTVDACGGCRHREPKQGGFCFMFSEAPDNLPCAQYLPEPKPEPELVATPMRVKDCKFLIFNPEHYREDGSCRCNDPEHQKMMIAEWGYSETDFANGDDQEDA